MTHDQIVIHENTNLFDLDVRALGHGCNTQGLMGKGIAKEFRDRFPRNYFAYQFLCSESDDLEGCAMSFMEHGKLIFNLFTQIDPGHYSKSRHGETVEQRLDFCFTAFLEMFSYCKSVNVNSIGIPAIGAGISGLDWDAVYKELVSALDQSGWEGTLHIAFLK